jgi:hypothetical protein
LLDFGGGALLNKYDGSPFSLISFVYPNYDWLPWKFYKCPQNYWDDKKNHLKFMNWAATELHIKNMEDWYKITFKVFFFKLNIFLNLKKNLIDIGGGGLLHKYEDSPSLLITTTFPNYNWLLWKFSTCPQNFWEEMKNCKNFMNWVGKQLNVTEMENWYKIQADVKLIK